MRRSAIASIGGAVLLVVGATCALAEPLPRVTAEVAPPQGTVGQPLALTLTVELPPDVGLATDPLPDELGPFELRSGSWSGPLPGEHGRRWSYRGEIAAYETGALELPPIGVRFDDGAPGPSSAAVAVEIVSVLDADTGPEAELAGLRDQARLEPDYTPLWLAAGVVLVALAALAGLWWAQRRIAARLAAVPVPDDPFRRMAPHEWALERLARLRDAALDDPAQRAGVVAELTTVVKRYLGGRYRLELLERTTAEVPPALERAGAPGEAIDETSALLERCDAVKFAAADPAAEDVRAEIDRAVALVASTRPVAVAVVEPDGARQGAA